jgi:hypothetical protein
MQGVAPSAEAQGSPMDSEALERYADVRPAS